MTMQSIEPLHTSLGPRLSPPPVLRGESLGPRLASHIQASGRLDRLVDVTAPSAFLEFMTAGKHPATLTVTIFSLSHRDLACRCSQSMTSQKKKYMCTLKIGTGLPWESFSNFNLLRGCFTLLLSALYLNMRQSNLQFD